MKKYISFDRVIICLILSVLCVNFYYTCTRIKAIDNNLLFLLQKANYQSLPNYLLIDTKSDKIIGALSARTTIQAGQFISFNNSMYKVDSIKLYTTHTQKTEGVKKLSFSNGYISECFVTLTGKTKEQEEKNSTKNS